MPTCFPSRRLLIFLLISLWFGLTLQLFHQIRQNPQILGDSSLLHTSLAYPEAASRGSQFKIKLWTGDPLKITFSSSTYAKTSSVLSPSPQQKPTFLQPDFQRAAFLIEPVLSFKFKAYSLSPWGLCYAVLQSSGNMEYAFPRAALISLTLERAAELILRQLKRPWLHPLQLARQAQDLSFVSYRIGASSAVETGLWYEWKKEAEVN